MCYGLLWKSGDTMVRREEMPIWSWTGWRPTDDLREPRGNPMNHIIIWRNEIREPTNIQADSVRIQLIDLHGNPYEAQPPGLSIPEATTLIGDCRTLKISAWMAPFILHDQIARRRRWHNYPSKIPREFRGSKVIHQ